MIVVEFNDFILMNDQHLVEPETGRQIAVGAICWTQNVHVLLILACSEFIVLDHKKKLCRDQIGLETVSSLNKIVQIEYKKV